MPLSLQHFRVSVPEHVMTRAVGGSTVLLDVDSGRSFTLDAIGSRVWALLVESGSTAVAYDTLLNEFDVAPAELHYDLEALVTQLAANRLLRVHDEHA